MDSLNTVRQRIETGDREGAKRELGSILRADPQNVAAWALLAPLLVDPAQQADCYRQILRMDPGNREAAARLRALAGQAPPLETGGDRQPKNQFPPLTPDVLVRDVAPDFAGTRTPIQEPSLLGELRNLLGMNTSTGCTHGCTHPPHPRSTSHVTRPTTLIGLTKTAPPPEPLTPEDVIRLAGGALPPEQRQTCPKCDAVISRNATRCPWCGAPLSSR